MSPNGGGEPSGNLAEAIKKILVHLKSLNQNFPKAAATRFGSGWAWLCVKEMV